MRAETDELANGIDTRALDTDTCSTSSANSTNAVDTDTRSTRRTVASKLGAALEPRVQLTVLVQRSDG